MIGVNAADDQPAQHESTQAAVSTTQLQKQQKSKLAVTGVVTRSSIKYIAGETKSAGCFQDSVSEVDDAWVVNVLPRPIHLSIDYPTL